MGLHRDIELGFRSTFGRADRFAFSRDHDLAIIRAMVEGKWVGALAAIGCTRPQFRRRAALLTEHGFLVRTGSGYQPGSGITLPAVHGFAVRPTGQANSRYGKDGNTYRPGKRQPYVAPLDREAPPAACHPDSGAAVTMLNVRGGLCRWPHGDVGDEDFHLCGRCCTGVYCAYHTERARGQRQPTDAA
jgi:hypothetical protein